jgi:DNA-binding MarR family transcriptional regulator
MRLNHESTGGFVQSDLKSQVKDFRGKLENNTLGTGIEPYSSIGVTICVLEKAINKELRKWAVNHSELIVLYAMIEYGGSVTLTRLTHKLYFFTRQAIAMTTRALENRGLVSRESVKTDRRKIRIILTEKGFELIKNIILSPERKGFHNSLVHHLNEDELGSLIATLDKMVKGLRRKGLL